MPILLLKRKKVGEFLEMLIMIQPRTVSSGKHVVTLEEIVSGEASKMLSMVPELLDRKRAHETTFIVT